MLPKVVPSWRDTLDAGQNYLLQAFDIGLLAESEAMWEDEWKYNFTIDCDHPKLMVWNECLVFITIVFFYRNRESQLLFFVSSIGYE